MQASIAEAAQTSDNQISPTSRSMNKSFTKSMTKVSQYSRTSISQAKKLKASETLFGKSKDKNEIAIQTIDSVTSSRKNVSFPMSSITEYHSEKPRELDVYKEDWKDSLVFRKAM